VLWPVRWEMDVRLLRERGATQQAPQNVSQSVIPMSGGVRRAAVAALVLSSAVLLCGYGAAWWPGGAPPWVALAFAFATVIQIAAFGVIGARRRDGRVGVVWVGVVVTMLLLGGAFAFAILAPDLGASEPLLLGVPRRAALILYGIGVAPLVALSWVFVRSFDAWAPTDDDVARLREIRAIRERAACD
jgi:hypothetical protein